MIKVAIAIVLASIAIGLAALAAVVVVRNDSQQKARDVVNSNRTACIAEHKDTQTLNNLLVYIEGRTLENPQLTSAQRTQISQFYTSLLKTLPDISKPC